MNWWKNITLNIFSADAGRPLKENSDGEFFISRFLILLVGFFISLQSVNAANYYWRGNGGNWNDLTHWASSSGGARSAYGVPPTAADNVFSDHRK